MLRSKEMEQRSEHERMKQREVNQKCEMERQEMLRQTKQDKAKKLFREYIDKNEEKMGHIVRKQEEQDRKY